MTYATNLLERLGKALGLKKQAPAPAQAAAGTDEPKTTDTHPAEPSPVEAPVVGATAGE
jgi:hypothetical protein